MAFQRYDDSPSLMKPGVYQSDNVTEDQLGLNTIDLEKYSLGNWNSIVRNNRKFWSPLSDPTVTSLVDQGRPVQLEFAPSRLIKFTDIYYDTSGLPTDVSADLITFTQLRNNYDDQSDYPGLQGMFLKRDTTSGGLTSFLKDDFKMQYDDGYGRILERTASDIANNRLIIKLDSNLRTKRSRIVGGAWSTWWGYDPASYDDGDNYDVQFQLYFDFSYQTAHIDKYFLF